MWLQLADVAGVVQVAGQTRARAVGEHQGRRPRDRIGPAPASSARLNRVEVLAGGRTGGSRPAGAVLVAQTSAAAPAGAFQVFHAFSVSAMACASS